MARSGPSSRSGRGATRSPSINGSDSRFYHLSLGQIDGATGASAPTMTVVASDSGYVLHSARVNDLLIAPGERYKMVVDFTGHAGQNWVLANDATTPFPDGDESVAKIPQLMEFQVSSRLSSTDRSSAPSVIVETNNVIPPSVSLLTARLRIVQAGESSPGVAQLGDAVQLRALTDPPTENPQLGSTEAWASGRCATIARIPIRSTSTWSSYASSGAGTWVNGTPTATPVPSTIGPFQPPGAWESGPKDTFVVPKDTITVWVGKYTIGGTSVWHCHNLSHEDSAIAEMMRPLVVGNRPQTQLPLIITQGRLDNLIRRPVAR